MIAMCRQFVVMSAWGSAFRGAECVEELKQLEIFGFHGLPELHRKDKPFEVSTATPTSKNKTDVLAQ